MILYFLRHGWAGDAVDDPTQDEARELTTEAEAELRAAAELWRRLQVNPGVVLSSPLPRARRTAELLVEGVGTDAGVTLDDRLRPGANWDGLVAALASQPAAERAMFVGHSPDLMRIVEHLTGASRIALHVGGMVCVEFEAEPAPGAGKLLWLLDPDLYLTEPHAEP